ncbi:MAG: hypothetical protein N2745_11120 [Syntrophorhabdaceae bacterium]|nr:hypothetical protein [Syntrophorhabdaceae bacterium]
MKVIIEKVDLDTCLTGLILGVSETDDFISVTGGASEKDINDPGTLCIEAGGSGLTELNNFDHHDPERHLPPACRQAYDKAGLSDRKLDRLVEYVCMVDDRSQTYPVIPFPSLSNLFSGMLLTEKETKIQFIKGIGILKKVLDENLDPFSPMPDLPEWRAYLKAKEDNKSAFETDLKNASFYISKRGLKVGFIRSSSIGGTGTLYRAGCDVVVLFNPSFGEPPRPKYTIAGNMKKVVHLLPVFDNMEKGWGGRDTIIGSPKQGSNLTEEEVLGIVLENL